MALQIIYLSALFAFIFMLMTLRLAKKPKKSDSIPKLPPGPSKLPLIGSIHHLAGSLPHLQLRNLAKQYGPLMHLQLGEVPAIVISSPDYAKEVMKTHDIIFSSRPQIQASKIMSYDSTSIAFSPYGEYWRQLRKICTMELLSPKRVQSFRPIREEEVCKLIKWIASQEGSLINLTQAVMSLIYTVTSRAAFGMKCRDTEEFISVIEESIKISSGFDIGDLFPSAKWLQFVCTQRLKLEKLLQRSDRIMENIINDHRDAKSRVKEGQGEVQEDLVDVLLKYEDSSNQDFHLTKNNIKAILLDVFGAGGETSAITIDWAMAEMMKNPRVMKKAQAEVRGIFNKKEMANENCINELKYLKSVIKETLRLHPAAPLLLPRECGQACEINGYHIPFKTKVIINAWAIARDPKYWNEPERFNPERFIDSSIDYKGNNFEYIPFGAGRRICPGKTFAAINVELVLAFLLYHFDWKLPSGVKNEELDMTESFGVTVRRKDDLCLIPSAYCGLPG